ncbi:MAG: ferritin [Fastidiosipilaceae bacterium]|jgi:ferritin
MKLSDKLLKELNKQYNLEVQSAFIYRHMAIWANARDWGGMANWFEKQYEEEMEHAEKIYNYINERNADVELDVIEKPEGDWSSMLEVMKAAQAHEEFISRRFVELSTIAMGDKDFPALVFLTWFHKEQVEEEEQSAYWVNRLAKCEDKVVCLMKIDGEMGARE